MIVPGDLVMVIRPRDCCDHLNGIGFPFTVLRVVRSDHTCPHCLRYREAPELLAEFEPDGWIEVSRLVKLDPPAARERVLDEAVA